MRFDLPLTAFALESSGAAARALGACHTLTLPMPTALAGERAAALVQQEARCEASERVGVPQEAPPSLTITL